MEVSASGLSAERTWMNVAASSLANARTTRRPAVDRTGAAAWCCSPWTSPGDRHAVHPHDATVRGLAAALDEEIPR
jgi:hypothetical protein